MRERDAGPGSGYSSAARTDLGRLSAQSGAGRRACRPSRAVLRRPDPDRLGVAAAYGNQPRHHLLPAGCGGRLAGALVRGAARALPGLIDSGRGIGDREPVDSDAHRARFPAPDGLVDRCVYVDGQYRRCARHRRGRAGGRGRRMAMVRGRKRGRARIGRTGCLGGRLPAGGSRSTGRHTAARRAVPGPAGIAYRGWP